MPATSVQSNGIKVFISYKKHEATDTESPGKRPYPLTLKDHLEKRGFDIFLDVATIRGGEEWAKVIYANLYDSDVLILLLEPEAAKSEWVQREVDMARGAQIRIYPLLIIPRSQRSMLLDEAQKKLGLFDLQYEDYPDENDEAGFDRIAVNLSKLRADTRKAQKVWYQTREDRWRSRPPVHAVKQYRTYLYDSWDDGPRVHIALGNILDLSGFDIIVNSENNFMQMARFHEKRTLSSRLRVAGAQRNPARPTLFLEDTIQRQLDQATETQFPGRPIPMKEVVVTTAGHVSSLLVKSQKIRFIFHVASVDISGNAASDIVALSDPDGLFEIITNCFGLVRWINDADRMNDPKTALYIPGYSDNPAANRDPLKSIIFPLFGSGHGGRPVSEVVPPIVSAILQYLQQERDNPGAIPHLQDIYLSVYSQNEVDAVEKVLDETHPLRKRQGG